MASSLEAAKLITAGYLYNYWDRINKAFRLYLSGAVIILILITSLGIYGFLTSAFQDTFNQFSIKEKQLAFLQQKEQFWADDLARYDKELERISNNISTLSNARSSSIQVRDTSVAGGIRNTISTTELRLSQKRIEVEEENRKGVQSKREVAADSLQSIQVKILDVESMEGVSSELGPLQYLSGLLDRPMDQIINWFILIIIFVFDPLAVALVIAFNNAVMVDRGIVKKDKVVRKRELYGEDDITNDDSDEEEELTELQKTLLMDVESEEVLPDEVGELELSEEEYEDEDLNKDGIVTEEERKQHYEEGGWKSLYEGKPYYHHPWFDWSKKERWINNRQAIDYWINHRGGSQHQFEKIKQNYPNDFTTKTY